MGGLSTFVGLLAAQWKFGPARDVIAVRLTFSPCAPAQGQVGEIPCRKAYDRVVPIPAFRPD